MSEQGINWKCTYKKMPKEVKTFLQEVLGKDETRKLMQAIRTRSWVMLVGPECSGKSTIRDILYRIGYPYVIDDNGLGRVIHTSERLTDLKPIGDILEELGIGSKHLKDLNNRAKTEEDDLK